MRLLQTLLFLLLISLSLQGYLTPQHIQQHIKRLITQRYQLYVISLGTTVNNNALKAYVITGVKKQQSKISELTTYPATLITSYMHPRQPYSIKLMQKVLDDVLNNFFNDLYFKYMLDNSLLILFPFVNIDGYYRYNSMGQDKTSKDVMQKYRKNMNKYGTCKNQWDFGVDINRNFGSSFGSVRTSESECGQEYRGPAPFSQKQSKAIRMLYKKFHITLAIDIHSYGNQWIYPYASQRSNQKLQDNQLYPLYQDLFQQFKTIKRPMKSCFESLGYIADGVYIDWALDQGALALAVQIGTSFKDDNNIGSQILFQTEQLFHIVLRKNSISYKKFLTSNNELVIQSNSLVSFQVQLTNLDGSCIQTKLLHTRTNAVFKIKEGVERVKLKFKNTIIQEQLQLSKLTKTEHIPIFNPKKFNFLYTFITVIVGISFVGLAIWGLLACVNKLKQAQQNRKKFSLPQQTQHQLEKE